MLFQHNATNPQVNRLEKEIYERDGILYPDVSFLPIKIDPVLFLQQVFEQVG